MATAPGKKYGTNPKCRPTKKYLTLCAKRFGNSAGSSTLSASESFVVISTLWRAWASCSHVCSGESNGKLE